LPNLRSDADRFHFIASYGEKLADTLSDGTSDLPAQVPPQVKDLVAQVGTLRANIAAIESLTDPEKRKEQIGKLLTDSQAVGKGIAALKDAGVVDWDAATQGAVTSGVAAVARVYSLVDKWGSLSDLRKAREISKALAETLTAIQPLLTVTAAEAKAPLLMIALVLSEFMDFGVSLWDGGGRSGGDGDNNDGDDRKPEDVLKRPDDATVPDSGGGAARGPAGQSDDASVAIPEPSTDDLADPARLKGWVAGVLVSQGVDSPQAEVLADKLSQTMTAAAAKGAEAKPNESASATTPTRAAQSAAEQVMEGLVAKGMGWRQLPADKLKEAVAPIQPQNSSRPN
jgi:hypothetical protein